VFSVTGADDETFKTPNTSSALQFLGGLNGANNRGSTEYLSDPESIRTGGSKHRKSSSYGSWESIARPPGGGAGHPPLRDAAARWSVASTNSIPDLLHSKRKSRSSLLHKSIISRPLESLPQSPDKPSKSGGLLEGAGAEEESSIVPRAAQIQPMRNTFVIRRAPETEGDRAATALQGAGRAVQRGRPPTPSQFSRLLQPEEAARVQSDRDAGGWI